MIVYLARDIRLFVMYCLRQWKTSLIPTYRVYRLYDILLPLCSNTHTRAHTHTHTHTHTLCHTHRSLSDELLESFLLSPQHRQVFLHQENHSPTTTPHKYHYPHITFHTLTHCTLFSPSFLIPNSSPSSLPLHPHPQSSLLTLTPHIHPHSSHSPSLLTPHTHPHPHPHSSHSPSLLTLTPHPRPSPLTLTPHPSPVTPNPSPVTPNPLTHLLFN